MFFFLNILNPKDRGAQMSGQWCTTSTLSVFKGTHGSKERRTSCCGGDKCKTPQKISCNSPNLFLTSSNTHTILGASGKQELHKRLQQTTNTSRVVFYFTLTEGTEGGWEWIVMWKDGRDWEGKYVRLLLHMKHNITDCPHMRENLISITLPVQVFDFRPHSSTVWWCVKTLTVFL